MYRTSRLHTALVPLVALAVVFTLAYHRAQAQVVPFKVTGGGVAADGLPLEPDVPAPHTAVGQATGLGKYYAEGMFQILQFTSPPGGTFDSAAPCVFTAADGSKLAFTYGDPANGAAGPGTFTLYPQ